ncbi:GNAT family N-acetyltransferase [Arthrobacter sp. GMC3]|uniref:GNAT family N-acetyltransferase n=1 Tax=Arthrobacter sp. GMC3 TaxID=2058894 RepID=UPI0011B03894|nr:GNAT family N-acetyltransferase [Arthrobacter sp. GMC3]
MTTLSSPWLSSKSNSHVLALVQAPPPLLAALASGDHGAAQAETEIVIPDYLVSSECSGTWLRRLNQIADSPGDAPWVTRLIVDTTNNTAVGRAGFHGPPDARGMVEVGYSVDPGFRRRGYARAALEILLQTADSLPEVHIVRATISPDNLPSRHLVEQFGFLEVGEQWDEEDGLEIIFEVDSSDPLMPKVRAALGHHGILADVLPCPDELSDTAAFCAHFGVSLEQSANAIVVSSRKVEPSVQALCILLGTTRLDVNKKVRELLGVQRASFADAELSARVTGMVMGGVTPFGVTDLPIYVDSAVLEQAEVVMGGGNRNSKLRLDPRELHKLPNVQVIEALAQRPGPVPEAVVGLQPS